MESHKLETRGWTADELAALDRAPLIRVRAHTDGTPRSLVPVGHVRVGGDELIRSLRGPTGGWYEGAVRSGHGEIDVDGRRIRVAFIPDGRESEFDHALRSRYGDDSGVRQMTRSPAREATLQVVPLA